MSGTRSEFEASTCVSGLAAASPGTAGIIARDPRPRKTRSPRMRRKPPPLSVTSTVIGSTNRASPMTSSVPVALKMSRCIATSPSTIFRFRLATAGMFTCTCPVVIPRPAFGSTSCTALALYTMFLLGRHATFGHAPPTIERSTTTVF